MSNPNYGALAPHRGIDEFSDATVTIKLLIAGAIDSTTAIYASPRLKDISYKMTGNITMFKNMSGGTGGHTVSGEGVEITFSILPVGSTKAIASYGTNVFRIGSPVFIFGAPIKKGIGHEAVANSPSMFANLLNTGSDASTLISGTEVAIITANDIKIDTEGNPTSGTLTVVRMIGHISTTLVA